jgi:drug/metabolite transporter (DMT)-like permease
MRYAPVALVVLGNVLYHIGQKTIPTDAPPVTSILCAYVTAILCCFALLPALEPGWTVATVRASVGWGPVLVGVGIAIVELGFLFAYRAHWPLSTASLVVSSALAVIMLPIGVLGFRETWSPWRPVGIGLCLLGLWLVKND